MTDNNTTPQAQKSAAAATTRPGAAAIEETAQATGSARRREAAVTAEATERAGRDVSEAMHRSSAAGEALGNAARDGAHAAAADQGWPIKDMAGQIEATGRQLAQAIQGTADNMRTLLALLGETGRGLPDLQQTMGRFVDDVMQTNLRATQEAIRLVNPGLVFEVQQRFARDCLDMLVEGSTGLLHSARRVADEAMQPRAGQDQRRGRIAEVMTREVGLASPDDTVQQAARLMQQEDTGVLAVSENDRLVGMVTDRDLARRLVAEGRDPTRTKVREVMTAEVPYIFEDEELHRAADTMAEQQVHRLPVLNRDKRLVGIVSLSDLPGEGHGPGLAGRAPGGIARGGGLPNQVAAE